jgi:ubiquinone biosynthesis protein
VTGVLLRHASGALVDQLESSVRFPGWRQPTAARSPTATRLRRALEDLGPTFMKLGQVLSTRPDLIPPRFETELALLQDSAPIVETAHVRSTIEGTFGRPLNDLFARFDVEPIAAASIGQVHTATLPDGRHVVVKVRRPGVVAQVAVDLQLLNGVARFIGRHCEVFSRYDPVGLTQEFGATLCAELDYPAEGRNAERIAANFADDDTVHIPAVAWELTSQVVITEERIQGIKIDNLAALDAAGHDRPRLAQRFANAYLSMVFAHRFFHADPHPGNVFVERDGRVGFVDFGMVG